MTTASVTAAAAFVVLAMSVSQVAQEGTPAAVRHLGFVFEKGGCELGPLNCLRRQPREWATGEIDNLKVDIDAIVGEPLGALIIKRCQQRGFTTLRRYGFPASRRPANVENGTPDAELYRDPFVKTINILDGFFRSRGLRDQFSGTPGYLLSAQILLHECFHAIDDVSGTAEFVSLVGFVQAGSMQRFAASSEGEISALTRYGDEITKLSVRDRGELWRAMRSFALQMRPVRVPSMQSLQSPAEAFADIGSHLVLDRRARQYLPPAIVVYFDKNVLSAKGL